MQLRHNCIIVKNIGPLLKAFVVIKLQKLPCSETNYLIKINIQWVRFNTYCATRNKKLVLGKNEGQQNLAGLVDFPGHQPGWLVGNFSQFPALWNNDLNNEGLLIIKHRKHLHFSNEMNAPTKLTAQKIRWRPRRAFVRCRPFHKFPIYAIAFLDLTQVIQ